MLIRGGGRAGPPAAARLRQPLVEQHERAHLEGAAWRRGGGARLLLVLPDLPDLLVLLVLLGQPRQRAVPQLRGPAELAIWAARRIACAVVRGACNRCVVMYVPATWTLHAHACVYTALREQQQLDGLYLLWAFSRSLCHRTA